MTASIGAGGMGEVYRARDTRLNRSVAIKVLPAALAGDPDRLKRLQREAQLLAALNNPHIATIHGLEESGGTSALIMELVDGEDLRQRLARGPLPLDEAVQVAREVALALEAAHEQGIIHRDLKPANIKVRPGGDVKVLDFGLAKLIGPSVPDASEGSSSGDLPTVTSPATTSAGALLGTAAYMSPEQARGQQADKRSDIWAFGCVLYETLTGRAPFPGSTLTDVLGAVLHREPDWTLLPESTPASIRRLLRRCLEKDPKRRLHDIADARIELEDPRGGSFDLVTPPPTAPRRSITAWVLAGALVVLAGVAGWFVRPVPVPTEVRLDITTPPTTDSTFAVSPDGRMVAFVGPSKGALQLWLRSLDRADARPLPKTDGATRPFWSPDGKSLGFFADARLLRIDISDGSLKTLATNAAVPIGGAWGPDGTILFSANPAGPVRRVPATGGESRDATHVDAPRERGHFFPQFLPDGRRFLFYLGGTPEVKGVYIAELDSDRKTRLFDADAPAVFVPPGYLVFPRGRQLLAQRFDMNRAAVSGEISVVADDLSGQIAVAASAEGRIAYRTVPGDSGQRQLLWLDRTGRELERVVYPGFAAQGPALSHDGRYVAVFRFLNGNMDLWSYDRTRAFWDRLTFDPGDDIYPLWSPDDRSLIYAGVRNAAPLRLFTRLVSGSPESERSVLKSGTGEFPVDWSADGRYLLFTRPHPTRTVDIWALSLTDPGAEPFEVVATNASESQAQFSPDAKWVAYQSDKTGRDEIYLRPFPGPGSDLRVSADGGIQPRWRPNGHELFYIGGDDRLMAVSIATKSDGTVDIGKPAGLFPTDIGGTVRLKYRQQYMVTPDGKAFVINSTVDQATTAPIVMILNWKPGH